MHTGFASRPEISIPIPPNKVGLVIGNEGETINRLTKLCPGVSRACINNKTPTQRSQPTLEIWGSAEGCSKLEDQVNQLIHDSVNRHDLIPEFSMVVFDGRPEVTACFKKSSPPLRSLWLKNKDLA